MDWFYFIIGIILLILAIILYFAILKIRDNTSETNLLLRKLIDMQDSTPTTLKRKYDSSEENTKTKKFIDILEKADNTDGEEEFTSVEKDLGK